MTASLTIQLLASLLSGISLWQTGNKTLAGPAWGLVAQAPWFALVFHDGLWGILPITVAFAVIHLRNLLKWRVA